MPKINALIFDLGNVLLDLHYDRTRAKFQSVMGEDWNFEDGLAEAGPIFDAFQLGRLPADEFFKELGKHAPEGTPDARLRDAWNSTLGGVPIHRLEMLKELAREYRLFLLSNTNATHMAWFDRILKETHGLTLGEFFSLFEKTYLSFELGLRKPDLQIFRHVIQDAEITAENALFIDDLEENIEAASALGLQVYLHNPEEDITGILPGLL